MTEDIKNSASEIANESVTVTANATANAKQNTSATPAPADVKNIDSLTFREAMNELNGIVRELDSNTLELEDSLKKYERGVALVRTLKVRLNEAQQKVDVLMGELEPEKDDTLTDTTLS